jgi:polyphosphate kinase 2 (PPK2 family)
MLEAVDLTQSLPDEVYEKKLKPLQNQLHLLAYQVYKQQRAVVIVLEGWDAAGKGGVIQRLTEHIDPRGYIVHPIAAPAGEDKDRHYLYRFWRRLPETGEIAIFDRSWYGRVLVERVEGFCPPEAWQRAYAEINQFERELVEFGMLLFKFWLHISPEEQLRRFEARGATAYKSYKLTPDDWRNREQRPAYEAAVEDMLARTSPTRAPWVVVPANDKRLARITVLQTVVKGLGKALDG